MYIRSTDSPDLLRKLISLKIQNRENQWKIMYIRCTDRSDLFKTLNSLNVYKNPMENCLLMYYSSKFDENFEIVESTKS